MVERLNSLARSAVSRLSSPRRVPVRTVQPSVWVALLLVGAAVVASSPPEEEPPVDVFSSAPGPFFTLSEDRRVVDWLVTVEASRAAFPPESDWTEFFEVELDLFNDGINVERLVAGQLARVTPDGRSVLSSTVASVTVVDTATLNLVDRQALSPCLAGVCRKQYVLRFVMSGVGMLQTQWFLRAGIEWDTEQAEIPQDASLNIEIGLL